MTGGWMTSRWCAFGITFAVYTMLTLGLAASVCETFSQNDWSCPQCVLKHNTPVSRVRQPLLYVFFAALNQTAKVDGPSIKMFLAFILISHALSLMRYELQVL